MRSRSKASKSLILLVAAVTVLAGCGGQASSDNNAAAKEQFLEERSAAATVTPDPDATPERDLQATGRLGMMGGDGPGVFGRVEKVEGRIITVSNPMDSTSTTVELAADAKVYKQVEAQLSDIKVGERITAIGNLDGDTLTAEMVQIGVEESTGLIGRPISPDGPIMIPRQGGRLQPSETPLAGDDPNLPQNLPIGRNDGAMPQAIFGTVEKLDGDKITVKSLEGKEVTVQVGPETTFQKRAEVDRSEIAVGVSIAASGEKDGDVLKATQVQIMQALTRQVP